MTFDEDRPRIQGSGKLTIYLSRLSVVRHPFLSRLLSHELQCCHIRDVSCRCLRIADLKNMNQMCDTRTSGVVSVVGRG